MKKTWGDYSRKKWSKILERVEAARTTAQANHRKRAEMSLEDLLELEGGIRNALAGNPPPAWRAENSGKRRRYGELMRIRPEDKAVAHVLAAEAGLIDDPTPVKTALDWVTKRRLRSTTRQAVQQWVARERDNPGIATESIKVAAELIETGGPGTKGLIDFLTDLRRFEEMEEEANRLLAE